MIGGPTATGKTSLALDLAHALKGEILNGDSLQLYEGLPILTASPTFQDFQRLPHHLYGILKGPEPFSVADWQRLVRVHIHKILEQGRFPLIVGGTGFYLQALLKGLSPLPKIPDAIRFQAQKDYETLGAELFYQRLKHADPLGASAVIPQDRYRCLRAWEVWKATGKSLVLWRSSLKTPGIGALHPLVILLLPPKPKLYHAIERRFDTMVDQGVIEEVQRFSKSLETESLEKKQGGASQCSADPVRPHPLTRALGYKEICAYLQEIQTREEAINLGKQQTRHYAKRQSTWFSHQHPQGHIFDAPYDSEHKDKIFRSIQNLMHTHYKNF